jgi:predicted GNAT superfamily acetyltransferase
MLRAWPGADDAYVYGPVCVAESHRGQGILRKLFDEVKRRLPGSEAVLFIQKGNDVSRVAHSRLGMRQVAQFVHNGEDFLVFSAR